MGEKEEVGPKEGLVTFIHNIFGMILIVTCFNYSKINNKNTIFRIHYC